MRSLLVVFFVFPLQMYAQSASDTVHLQDLVREALGNNPELKAFELNRDLMDARIEGTGLLDNPELIFKQEEMPNFRWRDAMYTRIGLMQRFPFPGKLSLETEIAEINAEHAHHEHMEKANEVLAKLRSTYLELWFAQQAIALNRENAMLLQKVVRIAQTRFGLGNAPQQDVLKTYVEMAKLDNQLIELRQQELGAKSMLMALVNRPVAETLGIAYVPPRTAPLPPADTLVYLAQRFRGMLLHDSLSVEEADRVQELARREYLPDFTLGLEYVTRPGTKLNAWSVSAGIAIPFTPWGITRVGARVEETTIAIEKARQTLINSRNMVRSNILMLYAKAQGLQQQLDNYTNVIVPQSERSLQASLIAYQTGKADYIMLIDAYRMLVELSMEKLMLRMQFEQTVAELKREVGYAGIFEHYAERD